MVLQIPSVERWTREDFDRYFGQLGIQLLGDTQTPPNVPDYVVVPQEPSLILDLCLESIETSDIKICDFGEAMGRDTQMH